MLILTRKPGDAIVIDGGIRIVVLGVDARGVRLGIEAPSSVGIVREEILQEIAAENRRAVAAAPPEWLDASLLPPAPIAPAAAEATAA